MAGVVQKALFLCSVIDRVDLKPDKIHLGLVSGNPAAPAPQVCVQHPAPRRGVVLKNPVIQRYRLLRRVDSLLVQLFVSCMICPSATLLPCSIPFHMNLNRRTVLNRSVAASSQSEKLVPFLHLSHTILPGANS